MNSSNLLLLIPLLGIQGIFAGGEIALLSADQILLKGEAKRGSAGSRLALKLLENPEKILSTTLLFTSICIILISTLLTAYFLTVLPEHAELMTIAVGSPLVVLFGELIPKFLGQRYSRTLLPYCGYLIYSLYLAFYPFTRILSLYNARLKRLFKPLEYFFSVKKKTSREEIETMLALEKKEISLNREEQKLIQRILRFSTTRAKKIMIPLVRIDAIEEALSVREALAVFEKNRHSRMPVYRKRIDNIVGVLRLRDLMNISNLSEPITRALSPPTYASEMEPLSNVISHIREEIQELVVVVDEYGGAVGILTLEDILEEIVGEIQDEYDLERAPYRFIPPGSWMIEGQMEVKQINDILKLELPIGEYETLAGFLLNQFGLIPDRGDELIFDTIAGSFRFEIIECSPRKIDRVKVTKLASSKESL